MGIYEQIKNQLIKVWEKLCCVIQINEKIETTTSERIAPEVESINANIENISEINQDILEKLIVIEENLYGNSGKLTQKVLEGTSETYTNFQSLTYTLLEGTVDVTVDNNMITLPLGEIVYGNSFSLEKSIESNVTIDATEGKILITLVK